MEPQGNNPGRNMHSLWGPPHDKIVSVCSAPLLLQAAEAPIWSAVFPVDSLGEDGDRGVRRWLQPWQSSASPHRGWRAHFFRGADGRRDAARGARSWADPRANPVQEGREFWDDGIPGMPWQGSCPVAPGASKSPRKHTAPRSGCLRGAKDEESAAETAAWHPCIDPEFNCSLPKRGQSRPPQG
jgi:hypothetical protein